MVLFSFVVCLFSLLLRLFVDVDCVGVYFTVWFDVVLCCRLCVA